MLRPLIYLILAVSALAENFNYSNYKVFRMTPETRHHLDLLKELELHPDNEFDFWRSPTFVNQTVDLMVAPSKLNTIKEITAKYNLPCQLYINNVQTLIDQENPQTRTRSGAYTFDRYYSLEEMYDQMDVLAIQYSKFVKVITAGKTYENRTMKGVKLSFGENKTVVLIEGGMHAREWISPATVMYLMHQLLTSQNAQVRAMAEAYDWYMIPSVNPDGYVYSQERQRLWRKSRAPQVEYCFGVDLNRNWEIHPDFDGQDEGRKSHNPCDNSYAGPAPFSEVETQTYSRFLTSLKDKMIAYISFHSYSQLLLFPYGHTLEHLDNYDELYTIGVKTIEALSKRYRTQYRTGSTAEAIYIAVGTSVDWVKMKLKVPLTYVYELRDTGYDGFLLPSEEIEPNGEEVLDSLVVMFREAKNMVAQKEPNFLCFIIILLYIFEY